MLHLHSGNQCYRFAETLQVVAVVEPNLTDSPDVAVAERVIGDELSGSFDSGPNVIVCESLVTWKLRETGVNTV